MTAGKCNFQNLEWKSVCESFKNGKLSPESLLDNFENFMKSINDRELYISQVEDYEQLSEVTYLLASFGFVKDFSEKEERDYDAKDFPEVLSKAEQTLKCFKSLLQKLTVKVSNNNLHQKFLMAIVKLCATHSKPFVWSSEITSELSREVCQEILKFTRSSDVCSLLCSKANGCTNTLFKDILLSMRPSLLKDTWTKNPSNCQVFKWLLFNVKHPHLGEYIPDVLPPSLMFTDHHNMENKVLGIECLNHIIDNVPPSELKLFGRADVVYSVLFNLIYFKEPEVICILYPCILQFLKGQERYNPCNQMTWGRIDDVYHQLMWNMELEDKILLRREYSAHVATYIDYIGLRIMVHMKRTLRVLENYLSVFDGPEEISRINAMKALKSLIKAAEPRMEYNCVTVLKLIFFLVYDIESDRETSVPEVKEELINIARECLFLLRNACPEKFQNETLELINLKEQNIPALNILRSVYYDCS